MAKIKFEKWKKDIILEKLGQGYRIKSLGWWKTTSEHGKSQGQVECPCCNEIVDIYIWSFVGGGKRCTCCNVLLGKGGAYISEKEKEVNNG